MGDVISDLFVSLDGFAAGEKAGPFFGLGGPELEAWVHDVLARPQVIVMGRVTYQALAAMTVTAGDDASARMNELPKAVISNSLTEPLGWPNTRLLRGDLSSSIAGLKRQSREQLRIIGSLTLVRNMIRLGLVDLLRITMFPLTLGDDGREPWFAGFPRTTFDLAGSRVLDSRLVMLDYRPRMQG